MDYISAQTGMKSFQMPKTRGECSDLISQIIEDNNNAQKELEYAYYDNFGD